MDERLVPLLEFVDKHKLPGAKISLVRETFAPEVVQQSIATGLIRVTSSNGEEYYSLNKEGYDLLSTSKSRTETRVSNKNALVIAILALVVSVISLLVAIFRH